MLSVVFTATTRSVAAGDSRHVGSLLRVFLLLVHGFLHSGAVEELLDSEAGVADSEELVLVRLLARGHQELRDFHVHADRVQREPTNRSQQWSNSCAQGTYSL